MGAEIVQMLLVVYLQNIPHHPVIPHPPQRDGYHFRPNACFRNVDVLETLQKIMEHNTSFFQTDFAYDREMLREAAGDRNAPRHFLWMSRKGGTWCFPERSVHIRISWISSRGRYSFRR